MEIGSIIPYIMRLDAVEYAALLRGGGIAVTTASATMSPPSFSSYLQFTATATTTTPTATADDNVLMQRCDNDDGASHDEPS